MNITGGLEHKDFFDVIDSTNHMACGGVKDAWYLGSKMMPLIKNVDTKKEFFDMVVFDGVANVQKAGRVIAICFPKVVIKEQRMFDLCSL